MSLSVGNDVNLPAPDGSLPRVFGLNAEGAPQASEWLHPDGYDYAGFNDNAAIKRASDNGKWAGDQLASIDNLRANPHPEDTPARHARKVREKLDSFNHAWAEKWDGTKAGLKAELNSVDTALEQKAGLKSNPAHFDAITAAFHGMKPEVRSRTLSELVEQGESAALATLMEAPLFLTGLSAEQRDSIRIRVLTKVDPAGLKLRDQLAKVMDRWEEASLAGIRDSGRLRQGTDSYDAKTKAAEAVAKAAGVVA